MDTIPTRRLGPDGPEVGAVGLGCMGMTWAYNPAERDDDRSVATVHRALDEGVTLIDTADVYGPFTNEELVGRALAGRRDEAVLATKCGLVGREAATERGFDTSTDGRPEHVREAIDASLARLATDHVDLYQLHRVDPDVPLAETWGAMAETVAAGKALAIGLSEVSIEQAETAQAIHPVASVQSELSLWTRDHLAVVDWCHRHDAAFISFSPLGRGFLTGTISRASFDPEDFRSRNPRFTAEAVDANQTLAAVVVQVARRARATPAQVALAWVLARGEHVVPIPGTTRPERVAENAGAAVLELSSDDLAELDAVPLATGSRY